MPELPAVALDDVIVLLERTPATLDALLRGLPSAWTGAREGGETFSPFDIAGHLVHGGQTDWIPRARIIREHGVSKPFERYDCFAQQLVTWAAHDLTHLHQLARVLAHRVRNDVGPWQRYLGVLHCAGHGE